MGTTETDHRIIATDWQLEAAAQGRLGAVIVPLEPQPKETTNTWFLKWGGIDRFWFKNEVPGRSIYDAIEYQEGDRLYLAEDWAREDDLYIARGVDPQDDERWFGGADDMPPEAAQYWFAVMGVRVCQCKDVNHYEAIGSGITEEDIFDGSDGAWEQFWDMATKNWNAAHPDHTWNADRWVVVLEVKDAKDSA